MQTTVQRQHHVQGLAIHKSAQLPLISERADRKHATLYLSTVRSHVRDAKLGKGFLTLANVVVGSPVYKWSASQTSLDDEVGERVLRGLLLVRVG